MSFVDSSKGNLGVFINSSENVSFEIIPVDDNGIYL